MPYPIKLITPFPLKGGKGEGMGACLGDSTGEPFLDELIQVIDKYPVVYPQDVALLMKVDERELRGAFHLLTGMKLRDFVAQWRVRRVMEQNKPPRKPLQVLARLHGWPSIRAMNSTFEIVTGHSARWWYKRAK